MIAFKTHLDLIGKFKWVGKITYNVIKQGLANTLLCSACYLSDSGERIPRRFFRWFWDFLKEEKVFLQVFSLKRFTWNCFSKCNLHYQSVRISWVLIAEHITKISHTQHRFYWNSTFLRWILIALNYLLEKFFNQSNTYWPREQKALSLTIATRFIGQSVHGFGFGWFLSHTQHELFPVAWMGVWMSSYYLVCH